MPNGVPMSARTWQARIRSRMSAPCGRLPATQAQQLCRRGRPGPPRWHPPPGAEPWLAVPARRSRTRPGHSRLAPDPAAPVFDQGRQDSRGLPVAPARARMMPTLSLQNGLLCGPTNCSMVRATSGRGAPWEPGAGPNSRGPPLVVPHRRNARCPEGASRPRRGRPVQPGVQDLQGGGGLLQSCSVANCSSGGIAAAEPNRPRSLQASALENGSRSAKTASSAGSAAGPRAWKAANTRFRSSWSRPVRAGTASVSGPSFISAVTASRHSR